MGYVAVSGGETAIKRAEELLDYYRLKGDSAPLKMEQLRDQQRLAIDKVMSEGALYAPDCAAIALKQSEGDTNDAALIMRAYRATKARRYYSLPVDTEKMQVIRRISAAFQEIPGGQILGPTRDYVQKLLDFLMLDDDQEKARRKRHWDVSSNNQAAADVIPNTVPRVTELLRQEGLIAQPAGKGSDVYDITRESLIFPCPRSAKLQSLTRGETGAMMALAYSCVRGYGDVHPCIAELRVGYVPLMVEHPLDHQPLPVGKVLVTEVEVVAHMEADAEDNRAAGDSGLVVGYGLCFGHNELKAIAMGILDCSTRSAVHHQAKTPAQDEEFVLYHIDGVEASGFVTHFKMPHYVTFQSTLDRLRKIKNDGGTADE